MDEVPTPAFLRMEAFRLKALARRLKELAEDMDLEPQRFADVPEPMRADLQAARADLYQNVVRLENRRF